MSFPAISTRNLDFCLHVTAEQNIAGTEDFCAKTLCSKAIPFNTYVKASFQFFKKIETHIHLDLFCKNENLALTVGNQILKSSKCGYSTSFKLLLWLRLY